jgi:hypothetical protein
MPKKTIDYSKTIIYKLVHNEDYDNANIYIGSTTDFVKRKYSHKISCNNEKDKSYNHKKYPYIRENGGWNEWNMIEIEKFPCNDGNETRAREEYWRSHFNAQLNMTRPYITEEQRKQYQKEYYDSNKDIILEKCKKYTEINKDKIAERSKGYYQNNKDKILEHSKEYNEQNRHKILEKNKEKKTCECGCIIRKYHLDRHRKSQKHLLLTNQMKYEFVDDNDDN